MFYENLGGFYGGTNADLMSNLNNIKLNYQNSDVISKSADVSILNSLKNTSYDDSISDEIEELEYQIAELMAKISQEISDIIIKSNKKLSNRRDEIEKATQEALSEYQYRRGSMTKDELVSLLRSRVNTICALDDDSIPDYISKSSDKFTSLNSKLDNLSSLVRKQSSDVQSVLSGSNTQNKIKFLDLYSKSLNLDNKLSDSRLKNNINEDEFVFSKKSALTTAKKQVQEQEKEKQGAA